MFKNHQQLLKYKKVETAYPEKQHRRSVKFTKKYFGSWYTSIASEDILINRKLEIVHTVRFELVNEELSRRAAIKTKRDLGLSGMDADEWRRILASNIFINFCSLFSV